MIQSNPLPRRRFLQTVAGASALLLAPSALRAAAPVPVPAKSARIKNVGLTTYSFRSLMRYSRGKTTSGKMEIVDFLEYCADNEIPAAELTSYYFPLEFDRDYLLEIRRRAHLLGIDLAAGAIGNNFTHAPGNDEAKQQLELTTTWIDHFADLGIPVMRVFAGNPPRGISRENAVENVVANLHEALAHAAKRGVMLGLENHDLTTDIDLLLGIVKRIDSKWFGLTFDSGNLARTADPYGDLARLAPHAISAQLKVTIPVDGKHQPTDFAKILRILENAGYRGYAILEYEENEDPLVAVPRYLSKIRKAFAAV